MIGRKFLIFILPIFFSLFFMPQKTFADIQTPDTISGDYLLQDNLVVPAGETLFINPGARIYSENNSSITIFGALNAVGTKSEPIQFESVPINFNSSLGPSLLENISTDKMINISNSKDLQILSSNINALISLDNSQNISLQGNRLAGSPIAIMLSHNISADITKNDFYPKDPKNISATTAIYSTSSNLINAVQNWWGDTSGPYHLQLNPQGFGESIYGNVNFSPWLSGYTNYKIQPKDIIISEVLSYSSSDSGGEWVELYNNLDIPLALFDFSISDNTSLDNLDIYLPARSFIIIAGNEDTFNELNPNVSVPVYSVGGSIGNGLANSGDKAILKYNDIIIDEVSFGKSDKNFSFARFGDNWQQTSTPTPGFPNSLPPQTNPAVTIATATTVSSTSSKCRQINISKIRGNLGGCVIISGKVENPSGNTFYIRDKSGRIKIYLTPSRHIKKPRLFKGDTVRVQGIANLYRNVYRILPRVSSDIRILQRHVNKSTAMAKKTATTKKSTTKKTAKASIIPKAQAAVKTSTNNSSSSQKLPSNSLVKGAQTFPASSASSPSKQIYFLKLILLISALLLIVISFVNIRKRYVLRK